MPKKLLVIFAAVIVIFTLIVFYLFQDPASTSLSNKAFVSTEWEETFSVEDKNPNGIFLFNELLEFQTKKTSTIIDQEIDSLSLPKYNTSYFFIGDQFLLKTEEFDSILNRVEKGSNLFIAYNTLSDNIHSFFFNKAEFIWEYSDYLDVYVENKNMRFASVFQSDTVCSEWNLFPKNNIKKYHFDTVNSESSVQNLSNFLNFNFGKGHIYLHSNPKLFSNYQLLSKNGFDYAQFVAEKIPKNHQIKWLEIARYSEEESMHNQGEGSGQKDSSFLKLIFDSKTLTLALLISVLGIILYLIFRTKRSEPLIPYIPKSVNHSLIFADTIKEIYYRQQTPYNILQVMHKNFQVAVNKQFFVDISKQNNELGLNVLHEKSGISKQKIGELISKLATNDQTLVNFQYLEEVSKLQQEFYKESGIIKAKVKKKIDSKAKNISRKMFIPLVLIVVGIALILASFYFLHKSRGSVIVFWPLGILFLGIGIRMFLLPILKFEKETITFYFIFSAKKRFNFEELSAIDIKNKITVFTISDTQKFIVNHADISIFDLNRYEQIITTLKEPKL